MPKIIVHKAADGLYTWAAQRWLDLSRQAIAARGAFYVSLAGGSTPKKLYQLLAADPYAQSVDWEKVQVFFGDERCVPWDHPDSNYRMAKEALLSQVPIPESNIHGVEMHSGDVEGSAESYAAALERLPRNSHGVPQFDLMLLGMGDDGHTASLFPGTPLLAETKQWAGAVYVEKLNAWRVSLTFPVINASRSVLFLVTGAAKAPVLAQLFTDAGASGRYPVEHVLQGAQHELVWCLDEAAAQSLPASILERM